MDEKTKKLVIPAALAIAVLATGCGGPTPSQDAAVPDAVVADAGTTSDAGCVPPYEQIDGACQLVI